MENIITEFACPPIPMRNFDWYAYRVGYDAGDLIGVGRTKEEAINDLLEKEKDI